MNKTLYIPLYGKSFVSKKGLFLQDPKGEAIWAAEGFPLKGKAKSKWLCYYMGIRAAVFDDWTKAQMQADPDAVILHLGCGLDSRCLRVGAENRQWYDVDLPAVMEQRKRYYQESPSYRMLSGDLSRGDFWENIPETGCAIVILEGVSMYLAPEELLALLTRLCGHFSSLVLLMDAYTPMAAKLSKYKNPIHTVGAGEVFGLSDPKRLSQGDFRYTGEHPMIPQKYAKELRGLEKLIFCKLYVGKISHKLYRLYEFRKDVECSYGKA